MSAVHHEGLIKVSALIPLFLEAAAAIDVAIGPVLLRFQAELAGALALQAQLTLTPPGFTASLAIVGQLNAAIEAAIALGVTLPGIDINLSAIATLIADIQLSIGSLQAAVALSLALKGLSASVDVFSYEGDAAELGRQLAASPELGGLRGRCKAILIVGDLDQPGVSAALGAAFSVG